MPKVNRLTESIYEKVMNEKTRADVEDLKAIVDYNLMMGALEDPNEEAEDEQ